MLLDSDNRNGQEFISDDVKLELIKNQARLKDLFAEFL